MSHSASLPLAIHPVIRYPREAEAGKTYIMTVDLRLPETSEWVYEEEEYPIYCMVETAPLFTSEVLGEPAIVLHRFGGTYGPAKFLLTAAQRKIKGAIRVTLVNGWGVPLRVLTLVDIRVAYEAVPTPESQLRITRQMPYPGGGRASSDTHIVQGIQVLRELMKVPAVYEVVLLFTSTFRMMVQHIERLVAYKMLHNLLHTLQFQCYNIIEREIIRFPADESTLDSLTECNLTLQDIIGRMEEVASRASMTVSEMLWIGELRKAHNALQQATKQSNTLLPVLATQWINRVLSTQPVRINALINETVRNIRLPELARALAMTRDTVNRGEMNTEMLRQIEVGITELDSLNQHLTALAGEHDRWQMVDMELRMIADTLTQDTAELAFAWPDLKSRLVPLYASSTDEWAMALRDDVEKLESAIVSQDPTRMRQYFARLRRRAGERFYRVDTALLSLGQELQTIGGSLIAMLGILE